MTRDWTPVVVFPVLIGLFAYVATDGRAFDLLRGRAAATAPGPVPAAPAGAPAGPTVTREREPRAGECPNTLARITLPPEAAALVPPDRLFTVAPRTVAETLRANAELAFVPDRYARVAPRLAGVVRAVSALLGQEVEAGAVLAVLDAPELSRLKVEYLQAVAVRDLRARVHAGQQGLFAEKLLPEREFLEAARALEEAEITQRAATQRLASLGITPEALRALAAAADASGALDVVAPFAGRIVEAAAVLGENAGPERPLFAIADTARMRAVIDIYEGDVPRVAVGQKVTFTAEGLPGRRFGGRILALGAAVDERTRALPLYAELKNPDGLLRAAMFGSAEIAVRPPEPKLLIPRDAVQNDGDCTLVFVSPLPNVYQARKVELGAAYVGGFEVLGGLAPGEQVATVGSFLLKTEVLRGLIGAG